MRPLPLTATLITLNEEQHISRAIESVRFASEILVVDSGSHDKTTEIAQSLGARVIYNPWPGYGKQKNFAQKVAINDWILNIDADEYLSPELQAKVVEFFSRGLSQIPADLSSVGFPRKNFYFGRWIKHGGWSPDVVNRLYLKTRARWSEPNVHEELVVAPGGRTEVWPQQLLHTPFEDLSNHVATNVRYAFEGFQDLKKKGKASSAMKLIVKPIWKFIHTYFLRLGFLDGMAGLIIAINAAHSMFLKYAHFYEHRNSGPSS